MPLPPPRPVEYPLINGKAFSFTSVILYIADTEFRAFKAISYGGSRKYAWIYGNNSDPLARTKGKNEYDGSFDLYKHEYDRLIGLLGDGYKDKTFNVEVGWSSDGLSLGYDQLVGCAIADDPVESSDSEEGTVVKVKLSVTKVYRNKTDDNAVPLRAPRGQ